MIAMVVFVAKKNPPRRSRSSLVALQVPAGFNNNVFVNCPFDDLYRPLLNAILFCIVRAGLTPRLAVERVDGGENRLQKIIGLMRESRYSIHDLSRCEAIRKGEIARLNMPFELGIDYGLRLAGEGFEVKRFLILDDKPHRLKQAISDIAGWDTVPHDGTADRALKEVRNWLAHEARVDLPGASMLFSEQLQFEEWKYGTPEQGRVDVDGWSPAERVNAQLRWDRLGRPTNPVEQE